MPLISILTVIKPPADGLEATLASVEREFGDATDAEFILKEWSAGGGAQPVVASKATNGARLRHHSMSLTALKAGETPALPSSHLLKREPITAEAKTGRLVRRHIRAPDTGVFDGMNQALSAATGEWILFLNAGDWLAEGFAAAFREAAAAHTEADYLYFDGVTVDAADGREFLRQAPETVRLEDFLHRVPILHPCLIVRHAVLKRFRLDPAIDLAADFDLMVRLVADGCRGHRVGRVGAFVVSGGLSEQRRVRARRQATRSLLRHAPAVRFRIRVLVAFLRFLVIHTIIVYIIRPLPFLRRLARARTGGRPAGSYGKAEKLKS